MIPVCGADLGVLRRLAGQRQRPSVDSPPPARSLSAERDRAFERRAGGQARRRWARRSRRRCRLRGSATPASRSARRTPRGYASQLSGSRWQRPAVQLTVVAQGDRGQRLPVDGERQHQTVVVVGVLADEVHPARRRPDPVGLAAGELAKGRCDPIDRGQPTARRRLSAAASGATSVMYAPPIISEPATILDLVSGCGARARTPSARGSPASQLGSRSRPPSRCSRPASSRGCAGRRLHGCP